MCKIKYDIIAAVATAAGRSAISLIRVSGPETHELLKKVFKAGGRKNFPLSRYAHYGCIVDPKSDSIVDKVVVTCFFAPASYTGEDLAEISTHGNPVIVSRVLQLLLENGARLAEAGEFTRRAFLHGKFDLMEVEAVAQLVSANSISQTRLALNQLEGLPSHYIERIRGRLIDQLVQLEASLNFPEDAIEAIDEHKLQRQLKEILIDLRIFAENAKQGSLVAGGLKFAIVGRPNVGKSSLLNYILGKERAIVTEIAGTTRDTLEENFTVDQISIKLIDTAGLRNAGDEIETIGIERTRTAIDQAFAVIVVIDSSCPMTVEDQMVIQEVQISNKPAIFALNKSDLPLRFPLDSIPDSPVVKVSALQQRGLDSLISAIRLIIEKSGLDEIEQMVLLGAQQNYALQKAIDALSAAATGVGNIYQDMLAIELEEAVRQLGRVSGETVDMNTLDLIFERFCIGK